MFDVLCFVFGHCTSKGCERYAAERHGALLFLGSTHALVQPNCQAGRGLGFEV
jgi:hypothetical protein